MIGLLLAITVLLGGLGATAWWVDWFGRSRQPPQKADAVVVLGAKVFPSGEISHALLGRAQIGAALYKQGLAPLVIFSGGHTGAPTSEAKAAQQIAVELGVPTSACLLEEDSHTTRQNAQFTRKILEARGLQRVVLVSDAFHLARAQLLFRREGIDVQPVASQRVLHGRTRVKLLFLEVLSLARLLAQ